jgi:hypothetical protein
MLAFLVTHPHQPRHSYIGPTQTARLLQLSILIGLEESPISFVLILFQTLLSFVNCYPFCFQLFLNSFCKTPGVACPVRPRPQSPSSPSPQPTRPSSLRVISFMSLISKHFLTLQRLVFRLMSSIPKHLLAFSQKHPGGDPFAFSFASVPSLSGITESFVSRRCEPDSLGSWRWC